jgi:hypothetical protein
VCLLVPNQALNRRGCSRIFVETVDTSRAMLGSVGVKGGVRTGCPLPERHRRAGRRGRERSAGVSLPGQHDQASWKLCGEERPGGVPGGPRYAVDRESVRFFGRSASSRSRLSERITESRRRILPFVFGKTRPGSAQEVATILSSSCLARCALSTSAVRGPR